MKKIALLASVSTATAACGGSEPAPEADYGDAVSIMTWNTDHGRESSMEEVADVVAELRPDIALFQETHGEEAEEIAAGLDVVVAPGTVSKSAYFSSEAVEGIESHDLTPGRWSRSLDVYTYRGLTIANAHLSVSDEPRQMQVGEVIEILDGADPAILAGDINAEPDSGTLSALEDAGWHNLSGDQVTFPEHGATYDYVLASRDVPSASVQVVETGASDHYPVVVEIAVDDLPDGFSASRSDAQPP